MTAVHIERVARIVLALTEQRVTDLLADVFDIPQRDLDGMQPHEKQAMLIARLAVDDPDAEHIAALKNEMEQ